MNLLDSLNELVSLLVAGGGVLILLILGLTQAVKQFGVKDKAALATNAVIGLVLGFLIALGDKGTPVGVQGWVVFILFSLVCCLAALGIYKVNSPGEGVTP